MTSLARKRIKGFQHTFRACRTTNLVHTGFRFSENRVDEESYDPFVEESVIENRAE